MSSVRDLITDALIEIGAAAPQQAPSAEDMQFAMRSLNRMLEAWNTEGLMVYTLNRETFPLTGGQQHYTLGGSASAANWQSASFARPVRIDQASIILNTNPTLPIEIPLAIMNDDEWQELTVKQTPSNFPLKIWISGNFPLNDVWLWPVPTDATNQIMLASWGLVDAFTNLSDVVRLPQGYEDAIVSGLAVRLSTSYGGAPTQELFNRAQTAVARVKAFNSAQEPTYMGFDSALIGNAGSYMLAIQSRGRVVE